MAGNPANLPAGNANNLAAGNAIVYLGDEGATPVDDVGYLEEEAVTLSYSTEILDSTGGFPATSLRQFVQAVTCAFSFSGREWNLSKFAGQVGGTYTTTDLGGGQIQEALGVGITSCIAELTAKVEFCIPCTSDTIEIDIWRVQPDGALEIAFNPTGNHNFARNFTVQPATQKWDGSALTTAVSLFEIRRTPPPP